LGRSLCGLQIREDEGDAMKKKQRVAIVDIPFGEKEGSSVKVKVEVKEKKESKPKVKLG